MDLSAGLPLATGFSYGGILDVFWGIVFLVHGLITFGLLYIYQKHGGGYGAMTFTVAVIITATFYFVLYWMCFFDLSTLCSLFQTDFPFNWISMISPLSVLYMPLAILLRTRSKALKGNGADETPKDQPN